MIEALSGQLSRSLSSGAPQKRVGRPQKHKPNQHISRKDEPTSGSAEDVENAPISSADGIMAVCKAEQPIAGNAAPKCQQRRDAREYSQPHNVMRYWIGLHKLFAEFLRLANATACEPKAFFIIQPVLLESGNGITQMRFELTPDFCRETGLCGQFLPPVFNGVVQIETGLILHNMLKVL